MRKPLIVFALLLVAGFGGSACRKDPIAASRDHYARGEAFLKQKKYAEAVLELRNAVKLDPNYGEARDKLGDAYGAQGDGSGALAEYVRAADLLSQNTDVQVKAGALLFAAGRFDDARARAEKALGVNPKLVPALLLRANALAKLRRLEDAMMDVQEAVALDPARGLSYANLAQLQASSGDAAEAEASFKRAVSLAPDSVDAHLAYGSFLWSRARADDAEAEFRRAAELEPKNPLVNRILVTFYLVARRPAAAEPYVRVLASEGASTADRFALADYYAAVGRREEGMRELERLRGDKTTVVGAATRLAVLSLQQGVPDKAKTYVAEALAAQPNEVTALSVKSQLLLAEGKTDEALAAARAAVDADAGSARARYVLGKARVAKQDFEGARTAFQEAVRLNPSLTPALMDLATLELMARAPESAVQYASDAVRAAPGSPAARVIYVRSLAAKGELDRATRELEPLLRQYPNEPAVVTTAGILDLARGRIGPARAAFERALAADPLAPDALTAISRIDLAEGRADDATRRMEQALAKAPTNQRLMLLAATIDLAAGKPDRAESLLKRAAQSGPANLEAYLLLSSVYASQNRVGEALVGLDEVVKQDPKAVWAYTMAGLLLEAQGKTDEAAGRYQRALDVDPRAAVAANNLAWITASGQGNLDVALQLAQTAKAVMPERAEVDDTLAFIYLKKGLAALALAPAKESVGKDPRNPVYHYRLGVALQETGDEAKAKAALEEALRLGSDFDGAADARQRLQRLAKG